MKYTELLQLLRFDAETNFSSSSGASLTYGTASEQQRRKFVYGQKILGGVLSFAQGQAKVAQEV